MGVNKEHEKGAETRNPAALIMYFDYKNHLFKCTDESIVFISRDDSSLVKLKKKKKQENEKKSNYPSSKLLIYDLFLFLRPLSISLSRGQLSLPLHAFG